MIGRSSSTVLAGVKGSLAPDPANNAGPALDPGCAPCSLTWSGAGLRPGASTNKNLESQELP